LIFAARYGHEACVRVLIAAKANVAYADLRGMTVLHWAAIGGNASICRVLLEEGASLTAVKQKNRTPLDAAKKRGNAECVAVLESAAGAVLPSSVSEVTAEQTCVCV